MSAELAYPFAHGIPERCSGCGGYARPDEALVRYPATWGLPARAYDDHCEHIARQFVRAEFLRGVWEWRRSDRSDRDCAVQLQLPIEFLYRYWPRHVEFMETPTGTLVAVLDAYDGDVAFIEGLLSDHGAPLVVRSFESVPWLPDEPHWRFVAIGYEREVAA